MTEKTTFSRITQSITALSKIIFNLVLKIKTTMSIMTPNIATLNVMVLIFTALNILTPSITTFSLTKLSKLMTHSKMTLSKATFMIIKHSK
jgi:hypothetical protein